MEDDIDNFTILMEVKGSEVVKLVTSEDGNTMLHLAVMIGDCEVVDQLLQAGVPVNKKNNHGYTAIMLAVLCHTKSDTQTAYEMVKSLYEYGANLDDINELGYHGCTKPSVEIYAEVQLHFKTLEGHCQDTDQMLMNDPNTFGVINDQILATNDIYILKYLIHAHPGKMKARCKVDNSSLLHKFVLRDEEVLMVELLNHLKKLEIPFDGVDNEGNGGDTAQEYARRYGKYKMLELLDNYNKLN